MGTEIDGVIVTPNTESRPIYEVNVDTGGSAHTYLTYNNNIFQNLRAGNESMVFFQTTDGAMVALPTRFLITHREK